jgi:iron complex outermembrane receptor protein
MLNVGCTSENKTVTGELMPTLAHGPWRLGRAAPYHAYRGKLRALGIPLASLAILTVWTSARAQETLQLEEVVVTAQKRSENVQDTPLTVNAYGAQALKDARVDDVSDLQAVNPALQISAQGAVQTLFLRGIGNGVTTVGNEASVPVYIDDIYYVNADTVSMDLANIARVEVLEGPQGTLFGRNASAGAISIYTPDPGADSTIQGTVGYANYNTSTLRVYAATPLTDTVSSDVAISYRHQGDGWGRRTTDGAPTYIDDSLNLRTKTIWRPTDSTTVKFIAYYAWQNNNSGQLYNFYRGTYGGGLSVNGVSTVPPQYPVGFYDSSTDGSQSLITGSVGGSIRIDQQLTWADLVSISAARRNHEHYSTDGDATQYPISEYDLTPIDQQGTQEFQLKSKSGLAYSWIVGTYYLNSLEGYKPVAITGTDITGLGLNSEAIVGEQRTKSFAGYTQTTFPIAYLPDTNLTLGGRYTVDQINGYGYVDVAVIGGPTVPAVPWAEYSSRFSKFTDKFSIDHHFTPDVMAYASYAVGYKSGLYNTLPISTEPLKPEINATVELGAKSELADHRLRLNASLFRSQITNPQVQSSVAGQEVLLNAGSATSKGFEFNADALVVEGLRLRLSGTYLDAIYTNFPNAPLFLQRPNGGAALATVDATGNQLPRASKYKAVGGINYTYMVQNVGEFSAGLNAAFSTRFYWDPGNNIAQPSITLINAALSMQPKQIPALKFTLWAKNLTGQEYYSNEYEEAGTAGYRSTAAPPRTFGLDMQFKY